MGRQISTSPSCDRFKDGSRIEALLVMLAYLRNGLQFNYSIERRDIYNLLDIHSTTQIGFVFRFYIYGGTFGNPP
jgi:hypothetical protein